MPNTLAFPHFASTEPLPLRRIALRASNQTAAAILSAARLGLLVFAAYAGSIIVEHVTEAMCVVAGHAPPAWSVRR